MRNPTPGVPAAVEKVLGEIRASDKELLSVSQEDGAFLRLLVVATGSTRVLEIGTGKGYSAIWIALGLRETGGRLTTIEYDQVRAFEAAANIRRAGLADIVRVISGDAFEEIPVLDGTFDFVFLDAWKRDYVRYFDLLMPRLDPGGLLLAHNAVNKRGEMLDFLDRIHAHPDLLSVVVSPSSEGIAISYRRK
jgi:caffeoyl-CoA O-methyltransferase